MPSTSYEIPQYGGTGPALHGWLMEAVTEGEIWLRAQKPTKEWNSIIDTLGPDGSGAEIVTGQSNVGYNKVRRIYRELVASLSNFKHAGEFKPTEDDAQELFDRAHLLTGLDQHWERVTFAHL